MPTRIQLCENCGGRMEVPHKWQKLLVCGPCHAQLAAPNSAASRQRSHNYLPTIAGLTLALGALGLGIVLSQGKGSRQAIAYAPAATSEREPIHILDSDAELPDVPILQLNQPSDSIVPPSDSSASADDAAITGSVGGWISLSRRGDFSAPQAGIRVQLLQPTVPRSVFVASLLSQEVSWRQLGNVATNMANAAAAAQDNSGDDSEYSPPLAAQELAAEAAEGLIEIRAAARNAPSELDTLTALRTLRDTATYNAPDFSAVVANGTVLETRTGTTGQYLFESVRPGYYYVHAVIGNGITMVEWCAPVHVEGTGDNIQIDLSNGNATVIAVNR